jgi:hypothetical protein
MSALNANAFYHTLFLLENIFFLGVVFSGVVRTEPLRKSAGITICVFP